MSFFFPDIVANVKLQLVVWRILQLCWNHAWNQKKSKANVHLWKFSKIFWISCATKMVIKLHYSLPRKGHNVSMNVKMNWLNAWIQHFSITYHLRKILMQKHYQPNYHHWLWARNNASKFTTNNCYEMKWHFILFFFFDFNSNMDTLQGCVVKSLEKCDESTPANLVESMFKFVRNETPCVNITVIIYI